MNVNYELRNLYEHYGHENTINAIIDLLETLACHCTDNNDNDTREPLDNAIDALQDCTDYNPSYER